MKLRGLKWTKVKLEDWNEIWKKLEGQFCILVTIIIKLSMKKKISLMSPFCWERHRTETHTQGSGNSGLIWHNSQHTKVGNSWILCEGFKPIGRHTHLGNVGQTYLIAFFEKDTRLKHTHCTCLDCDESCNAFVLSRFAFFFFIQPQHLTKSSVNSASVYYSWIHKFHFSVTFLLKMGSMALFTH